MNKTIWVCTLAIGFSTGLLQFAEVARGQEKPATDQPKVNYDEHVRPILREHCFSCHNANGSKGGLAH